MIGGLVAAAAGVPFVVLAAEIFAGLRPLATAAETEAAASMAVLIPAHDEAAGIGATVSAIRGTAPPGTRILVVADNCTDDTASRARAAGADVIERCDIRCRGKGYALAFGRSALAADPPAVVIVMDADCVAQGATLARIGGIASQTGRPVQAINLVDPPGDADAMGRVSTFAFRVKNLIRQRGLQRLTGTCVLTGTGMAFPWMLFRDAPLATSDSVEDLAIGLHFLTAGAPPLLSEGTQVTSPSPPPDAAVAQRTRWEHGFMATALKVAPRMIARGVLTASWRTFWLGLHLCVPPLALLLVAGAVILAALALAAPGAAMVFATIYAVSLIAITAAWFRAGRAVLPPRLLVRIPGYILWKLPIYLRLARGADRRWTRTGRG